MKIKILNLNKLLDFVVLNAIMQIQTNVTQGDASLTCMSFKDCLFVD